MALLTLQATFCFACCTACSKAMGARVPTLEKVLLRSVLCLLFTVLGEGPLQLLRTLAAQARSSLLLLALRGTLGFVALFCYFEAANHMPLVRLTLITRLHPAISTSVAPFVLGEAVQARAWVTLALATAGVCVVALEKANDVAASGGSDDGGLFAGLRRPATFLAFGAALFTSAAFCSIRTLAVRGVPSVLTVAAFHAAGIPLSLLASRGLRGWVVPNATESALLFGTALAMQLAQISMTGVLRSRALSRVAPSSFLIIVWNVLIGLLFFANALPTVQTLLGCTLVVGALTWGERRRGRARVAALRSDSSGE